MVHPLVESFEQGDVSSTRNELTRMADNVDNSDQNENLRALVKFLGFQRNNPSFNELEVIGVTALIHAIAICDQKSLSSALLYVLEQLVPRMALKSEIPQFAECMWQLYRAEPKGTLLALRKFGLKNSDSRIKTASIEQLQQWTDTVGSRIAFHDLTPTLVGLMKDQHKETREAAYALLVSFFSKSRTQVQQHLFITMEAAEISADLMEKMRTAIRRADSPSIDSSDIERPVSTVSTVPSVSTVPVVESIPIVESAPIVESIPVQSGATGLGILEVTTGNREQIENRISRNQVLPSPLQTNSAQLEIMKDPMYAFQPIQDKFSMSDDEFLSEVSEFVPAFDGKETENNWSIRLKHVKSYRTMIASHFETLSPKAVGDAFLMLRRGLCEAILSLRTVLVIEICYAIKDTIQCMNGQHLGFHEIFDPVLEPLAKVATGSKKITSAPAHIAICVMLIESASVSNRQFNIILSESRSIKTNARPLAYYWLRVVLNPSLIPSLAPHQPEVESIIYRAINDASPSGRMQGRELFRTVEVMWPSIVSRLLPKLNSSSLKFLNARETQTQTKKPLQHTGQPPSHFHLQRAPQVQVSESPRLPSPRIPMLYQQGPQSPGSRSPVLRSPVLRSPVLRSSASRSPVVGRPLRLAMPGSRPNSTPSTSAGNSFKEHPHPDLKISRVHSQGSSPIVDGGVSPRLTSSPIKSSMHEANLSKSIRDLSIRDASENHMSFDDSQDTVSEADMTANGDVLMDAAEEQQSIKARDQSVENRSEEENNANSLCNFDDVDAVKSAATSNFPKLLRSIALQNLSTEKIRSLLRTIMDCSQFKSRESLQSAIQSSFQAAESVSEGDGYMSILRILRDITDRESPNKSSTNVTNILDALESPPPKMANYTTVRSSASVNESTGPLSLHLSNVNRSPPDASLAKSSYSSNSSPLISSNDDLSSQSQRRHQYSSNAPLGISTTASPVFSTVTIPRRETSVSTSAHRSVGSSNSSVRKSITSADSSSLRSSSRAGSLSSQFSVSDTSSDTSTLLRHGKSYHNINEPESRTGRHLSKSLPEVSPEKLRSEQVNPALSSLLADASRLIPLFPTVADQCITLLRDMINRLRDLSAQPQDLASLAVIIKASTYEDSSKTPLAAPVGVWKSRFTFDMDVRESILPFLSSNGKSEEQIIAGLVLLRLLLNTTTSYSKPYLDTLMCLRHLNVVASNFQRENLEIGNLLLDVYDLVAQREVGSCVGLMNAILSQPNMTFSLQFTTKIIEYHADFANDAAKGLRVLVSKATRDPDVRVRQHLYPMLIAVNKQNAPVFDSLVTSMSPGQRKFVDYYLEVKT